MSFSSDAERRAATDCKEDVACANDMTGMCVFRHGYSQQTLCRDWAVVRRAPAPFCPRGASCTSAHPHHSLVKAMDCISCAPGVRPGDACAYTPGGAHPSLLRHGGGAQSGGGSSSSGGDGTAARHAATDCMYGAACRNHATGACPFRHAGALQPTHCKDWLVRRSSGAPQCPSGAACPYQHPHHSVLRAAAGGQSPPHAAGAGQPSSGAAFARPLQGGGGSSASPGQPFARAAQPAFRGAAAVANAEALAAQAASTAAAAKAAAEASAAAARAAAAASAAAAKAVARTRALVEATQANGGTALQVAAAYGDERQVAELLAAGEDPWARNDAGDTALHVAARSRCKEVLALLLPLSPWCTVNKEGWTPIDDALYEKVPAPTPQELQKAQEALKAQQAQLAQQQQQVQQWHAQQQQQKQQYAGYNHGYHGYHHHQIPAHCMHCVGTPGTGCLCTEGCPKQGTTQCKVHAIPAAIVSAVVAAAVAGNAGGTAAATASAAATTAAATPAPAAAAASAPPRPKAARGAEHKDELATFVRAELAAARTARPGDPAHTWAAQRALERLECEALDDLMSLTGLDKVKRAALGLFTEVRTDLLRPPEARTTTRAAMNFAFLGNAGTGKTSVARLFARLLQEVGLREGAAFQERTGQELLNEGSAKFQKALEAAVAAGSGVVLVDEVYQLEPLSNQEGRAITNAIMAASETHRHKLAFIVAGYKEDVRDKWLASNDGLRSRFPHVIEFDDFSESELRSIFLGMVHSVKWRLQPQPVQAQQAQHALAGGGAGSAGSAGAPPSARRTDLASIAARRLARGANHRGFGNARSVRVFFEAAQKRATERCNATGIVSGPELVTITLSDLLGPPLRAEDSAALKTLHSLPGLQGVKEAVGGLVQLALDNREREERGDPVLELSLHKLFLGNAGTGKTTVAKLYGQLLKDLGFLTKGDVQVVGASTLIGNAVGVTPGKVNAALDGAKGSVLVVDEAYVLDDSLYGKEALDTLVERVQGTAGEDFAVLLCGYSDRMLKMLREGNPGLARRFKVEDAFHFEDYDDAALLQILLKMARDRNVMLDPALAKDAVERKLSRQRLKPGFGNAGAVRNLVETAIGRMSARNFAARAAARSSGRATALLTDKLLHEDLFPPAPRPEDSEALQKLNALPGLESIKGAVNALVQLALDNREREERGDPVQELSLHKLFLGNAGTGKTTVAKLYGQLLKELGFLSQGDVRIKGASELIGEAVGVTPAKVNAALNDARGCVLVVDEAYVLDGSAYGKEALDTLVERVQGTAGEDFAVLLCGYNDRMLKMLREGNPGLARRFKVEDAFHFEDYDDAALLQILLKMARDRGLALQEGVARAAIREVLSKQRLKPNFGNAGAVRNLLDTAVSRMSARNGAARSAARASGGAVPPLSDVLLEADFFTPAPAGSAREALSRMTNAQPFLEVIERLEKQIKAKRDRGAPEEELFGLLRNYLFQGPPGTGKTTVARAFGEVLVSLGLLSTPEVVEVKGQDLIGSFVGHTAPLVNKKMEEARGGVLFIDEAYALAHGSAAAQYLGSPGSPYAKDALEALLANLTDPKYAGKMCVIMAGYESHMEAVLASNPGMSRRFPERLAFPAWPPGPCLQLVRKLCADKQAEVPAALDAALLAGFQELCSRECWGSAGDAVNVADKVIGNWEVRCADAEAGAALPPVAVGDVERAFAALLAEPLRKRLGRAAEQQQQPPQAAEAMAGADGAPLQPGAVREAAPLKAAAPVQREVQVEREAQAVLVGGGGGSSGGTAVDDADGGSGGVYPLAMAFQDAGIDIEEQLPILEKEEFPDTVLEIMAEKSAVRMQHAQVRHEARVQARRLLEAVREMVAALLEERRRLAAIAEEEERAKEKERQQQRLEAAARLGPCPAGYQWYKIPGGYRCGGGSHTVSDAQIDQYMAK